MQSFTKKKPLVYNSNYISQRETALKELDYNIIDKPILGLTKKISQLPFCFTMQSCVGHFRFDNGQDVHSLEMLDAKGNEGDIEYQIAYLAFCIDNCPDGILFLDKMEKVKEIDKEYIQFGSATWFWDQWVNSYVLQVQPDRFKDVDSMIIDIFEARHIAEIKMKFFEKINDVVTKYLP